jgi:hypothetical protein
LSRSLPAPPVSIVAVRAAQLIVAVAVEQVAAAVADERVVARAR